MSITLVTVVTNPTQYEQLIVRNLHTKGCQLRSYDNSQENLPIPTRYNHFIENELPTEGWVIFCHQDFEFLQDPADILEGLDTNSIYGPIGVRSDLSAFLNLSFHSYKIKPSLHKKYEYVPSLLGQIHQHGAARSFLNGTYISKPHEVDTLDCCCIIMHSSLIRNYQLRFDTEFNFHLYAEDLCLAAKSKGVKSKAIQINCCHYSLGNLNQLFWDKYHQLLKKYPTDFFLTTCVYNPQEVIKHMLGIHYPAVKKILSHSNLFQKSTE